MKKLSVHGIRLKSIPQSYFLRYINTNKRRFYIKIDEITYSWE